MKEIPLTQGRVALVDDDDYEWLMQWKWFVRKSVNTFYAVRNIRINPGRGGQRQLGMHAQILGIGPGEQCDHKDLNGLNNQRENIRRATTAENCANRGMRSDNKSGHRGVRWREDVKKWHARITKHGKLSHIGYFVEKSEAIAAYNASARELFGEFFNPEKAHA